MRYLILCLAVLLCIAPVSAGLLDFLNGPTTGIDWDKTSIEDHLKTIPADDIATRQERTSQGIAAKVNKERMPIERTILAKDAIRMNLSPKGDYYIRIDSVEYEKSTGMLKTYIYATRNGRELDIKNPVRWYGMNYTYVRGGDPLLAKQRGEEENPKMALLASIYSYLQTVPPGKVTKDGIDPTAIYYIYGSEDAPGLYYNDLTWSLFVDNLTANNMPGAAVPYIAQLSSFNTNRYVMLSRLISEFNTSTISGNMTITSANWSIYSSGYKTNALTTNWGLVCTEAWVTQQSGTVIMSDYSNVKSNSPAEWCDVKSYADLSGTSGVINTFTFTNAGLRGIFKGGYTTIALRFHSSDVLALTPIWSSNNWDMIYFYGSAWGGTSLDPFLAITYTVTDICPATTTCPSATTTPVCTSPAAEPGRMPVTLMYLMIPLALGLSLFSVWHYDNRVYANIVLGGMASAILWFFLAANVITGNIFLCSSNTKCVLSDLPLFWLFVLFGVIMTVYTLALAVEAIRERNIKDIGGEE